MPIYVDQRNVQSFPMASQHPLPWGGRREALRIQRTLVGAETLAQNDFIQFAFRIPKYEAWHFRYAVVAVNSGNVFRSNMNVQGQGLVRMDEGAAPVVDGTLGTARSVYADVADRTTTHFWPLDFVAQAEYGPHLAVDGQSVFPVVTCRDALGWAVGDFAQVTLNVDKYWMDLSTHPEAEAVRDAFPRLVMPISGTRL